MRYDPRDRLGRIRVRWIAALGAIALVPLFAIIASVPYQLLVQSRLSAAVESAIEQASRSGDFGDIARRERVRISVLVPGDRIEEYGRAVTSRWTNHVALRFVDRETADRIAGYDRAAAADQAPGCDVTLDESLLTCRATATDARGRTVVAEASSVRTISTLWGHRAPLLAVVLQMLALALGLGLWLGRRTVGPIDRLRLEVAHRTAAPVSTEPVRVDGRDEVADLGHSFNALLAALQAQRETNMDFLAEVAHELKTPIATIQQFADLVADLDDPRLAKPLAAVEASCSRLNLRTNELLELARASAGLPGLQREVIDLGEFVENLGAAHGGELEVESCAAQVLVSTRYLEIALRNVLDNAVAHARERVSVRMRCDADFVAVEVHDDGPGIATDEFDRIFERFHSHRDGGTGLGLAMTRAVLRAHGGDASARNDCGAIIELTLPLAAGKSHPGHI